MSATTFSFENPGSINRRAAEIITTAESPQSKHGCGIMQIFIRSKRRSPETDNVRDRRRRLNIEKRLNRDYWR